MTTTEISAYKVKLDKTQLSEFCLGDGDMDEIVNLAGTLNEKSMDSIFDFGRDSGSSLAQTQEAFSQVRTLHTGDLDVAGKKMEMVLSLTRKYKVHAAENRSRIPVVGRAVDYAKGFLFKTVNRMEAVGTQVDALSGELSSIQDSLRRQTTDFEQTFAQIQKEAHELGLHIAAGKLKQQQLEGRINELVAENSNNPLVQQELADIRNFVSRLDIRIGQFVAAQHSAFQTLAEIRLIQGNSQVVVERYYTIRDIVLPAWRRQLALRNGLNLQSTAIQIADAIDDTTQTLWVENAAILRKNVVESAKANQRLSIKHSTLRKVQDEIFAATREVVAANKEGANKRHSEEMEIPRMREEFRKLQQ
ncbi:toxic anion resistance protein [Acidithiobacillus sp. M4-SHS-6]|uniref:toxic anion resistance protein n=1 Tax=Acidithiobacillus sp. M4-SHS-6 TaxID=3383024 RepID=UPI0039BDCF09